MIPKTIHYCWFGNGPIPKHLQACIKTWSETMPDYKMMRWDESSFDVTSITWTKEAYEREKYAFVSDYVRLTALEQYGGIYLDTDVRVLTTMKQIRENLARCVQYAPEEAFSPKMVVRQLL